MRIGVGDRRSSPVRSVSDSSIVEDPSDLPIAQDFWVGLGLVWFGF
jgi:hypothetical protein